MAMLNFRRTAMRLHGGTKPCRRDRFGFVARAECGAGLGPAAGYAAGRGAKNVNLSRGVARQRVFKARMDVVKVKAWLTKPETNFINAK